MVKTKGIRIVNIKLIVGLNTVIDKILYFFA